MVAYDEHEVNNTFKFGVIYQKFGQVSDYVDIVGVCQFHHLHHRILHTVFRSSSILVSLPLRHQRKSCLGTMRRRQLSRSLSVSWVTTLNSRTLKGKSRRRRLLNKRNEAE